MRLIYRLLHSKAGSTYKPNVPDFRNSLATKISKKIEKKF